MSTGSDLIALAAWLRREAQSTLLAAKGAAEPYGQQLTLETAAKLERASEIVKEFADLNRNLQASPQLRRAND